MPGEEIVYLSVSELAKRIEAKETLAPSILRRHISTAAKGLGPRFITPTPA